MGDGAPLRVVMVSQEFPPRFGGGIGTCVRVLSAGLARRGHDVTVVTVGDEAGSRQEFEGGGVLRVVRLGAEEARGGTLRSWWGWSERAAAWLEGEGAGADVVEFPDYRAEGLAHLSRAERGGAACIVRLHTPLAVLSKYNAARRRDRVLEAMEIEAMLLADGVVSSSRALTAEVVALAPEFDAGGGPGGVGGVEFSRYGVEVDGQEGAGGRGIEAGRARGSDVVYVGRLEERKGVEVLVRAAGTFLRACPGARLHFVGGDTEWGPGEGSTRARLEAMLGEAERPWGGLEGRVEFHGAVEPGLVGEIVASARVCVFPSLFEAGPYACLEAMARGKAVVGTDRGGMAEMIEDGVSGMVARAGDADDLAAKLIAMLGRSDDELAAMGERARQRVQGRYSIAAAAEEAEGVYRRVIEQKRAAAGGVRGGGGGGQELAGVLAEVGRLERAWEESARRVGELEVAKDRIWEELGRITGEREAAAAEAARLADAWEGQRGRVLELEGAKDRMWDETQRLARERDAMRAEAERLAGEWELAAARVKELTEEQMRLSGQLNESRGERAAMQDRLSRLERAVEASQTQPVFKVLAKAGLVRRVGAGEAHRG